jgi:exodeoxyribonuclease V alpha subunit
LGCASIQGIFYPAQAARNPAADLKARIGDPLPGDLVNTGGMMKVEAQTPDREVLAGLVDRVRASRRAYQYANGVLRRSGQSPWPPRAGYPSCSSRHCLRRRPAVNDWTHGQRFKAQFLKTSAPTSVEGVEKYLVSGWRVNFF